ncbi:major type 1 subunit fimbrin (pilin) [Dyella sp. OK004]|uniref:fimbrial protein n=1 Tax=Dyella sp. OK004 TaxID=1855292 RepID=UPI0008E93421|nr:fimbrial protein [Dyella sp. OK004]SFS17317.1 major type 1 subunit fimbrin (pilin) [Dyella sp. OK004]
MTKTLITTALIAAFGFAALAPNSASAADGTINITGTVNASTCKINGGASPATINVALPTVSTTSLSAAGAVAGRTAFALNLTNCGSLTKAQTFFEPGPTIMADGNLKNASGTATGVEVQLLNSDFSNINLAGTSTTQASQQTTLTTGAGNLNYYAQYFATAAAGAGTVSTSVQFTMLYQ